MVWAIWQQVGMEIKMKLNLSGCNYTILQYISVWTIKEDDVSIIPVCTTVQKD